MELVRDGFTWDGETVYSGYRTKAMQSEVYNAETMEWTIRVRVVHSRTSDGETWEDIESYWEETGKDKQSLVEKIGTAVGIYMQAVSGDMFQYPDSVPVRDPDRDHWEDGELFQPEK